MLQPQPMIAVADVGAASAWFQNTLGLVSAHGGDEYEMLMSGDRLVLQLHEWDVHEHPHLGDPTDSSRGNGVMLWFASDDLASIVERIDMSDIVDGPLFNPLARHHEVWLNGPEGYVVVVAGTMPDRGAE